MVKRLVQIFTTFMVMIGLISVFVGAPVNAITDPLKGTCDATADNVTGEPTEFCKNADEGSRPLVSGSNSLLVNIAQIVVFFTAAISVVMIIIGGIKYVLSNGDSNATAGAKNTILYAVVGLIVALLAQLIVSFVLTKLFNS